MKRAAATAWLVSPHNTEEHLRLGDTARMDWVMSPSPGDALVCCVKKCGVLTGSVPTPPKTTQLALFSCGPVFSPLQARWTLLFPNNKDSVNLDFPNNKKSIQSDR